MNSTIAPTIGHFNFTTNYKGNRAMKRKAKQRVHNEYFRTVSLGNRKTCPTCKAKLTRSLVQPETTGPYYQQESIWSWGNYVNARWHTVDYFCRQCFATTVAARLLEHADECGCAIELVGYRGERLPPWLTLSAAIDAASEQGTLVPSSLARLADSLLAAAVCEQCNRSPCVCAEYAEELAAGQHVGAD